MAAGKVTIPVLWLVAGMVLGWFAHPPVPGAMGPAISSHAGAAGKEMQAGEREVKAGLPDPKMKKSGAVEEEEIEALTARTGKAVVEMQRAKFGNRLSELSSEIKLTLVQQEQLRAVMEARFTALAKLYDPNEDEEAGTDLPIGDLMASDGFDEAVKSLLTDDQRAGYSAFQEKEKRGRVDAMALRNLAGMSEAVDLSPVQREGVYRVLSEQAAAREEARKGSDISSFIETTAGLQDDELGLGGMAALIEGDQLSGEDVETVQGGIREKLKARVDSRVEAMRPYLTDEQLRQYRLHLAGKAAEFMAASGQPEDGDGGK